MSKIDSDTTWGKSGGRPARPTRFRTPDVADRNALEAKLACRDMKGSGNEKRPARNQLRFEAEWRWVRRMPSLTERLVVSSPSVCEVWAHRLLRQFSEPACVQACGDNRDPIIASFEPGEDWFYDYEKQGMIKGVELLPPHSHPDDQPVPGPAGRVPANWESLLQ